MRRNPTMGQLATSALCKWSVTNIFQKDILIENMITMRKSTCNSPVGHFKTIWKSAAMEKWVWTLFMRQSLWSIWMVSVQWNHIYEGTTCVTTDTACEYWRNFYATSSICTRRSLRKNADMRAQETIEKYLLWHKNCVS